MQKSYGNEIRIFNRLKFTSRTASKAKWPKIYIVEMQMRLRK